MTELTELFEMSDMNKLKYELSRLVRAKDYKTVNTLLRRNPNTWLFNTRELNEEIPCNDKHFTKRKGVMKFESRPHHKSEQSRDNPNSGNISRIRSRQ